MALTKISGKVIKDNCVISGIVTASTFTGPLTGDVTGNITGNLTGNVTGNLVGIVTGNINNSPNLPLLLKTEGSERLGITTDGRVNINGTPPWISSTAGDHSHLSISGTDAYSSGRLWMGSGGARSSAFFDLGGINFVNGTNIVARIKGSTASSATDDGQISFTTKESGSGEASRFIVKNDGDVEVVSGSLIIPDSIVHRNESDTKIRFPNNDTIALETSGLERLSVGSAGQVGIGSTYGLAGQVLKSNGPSAAATWTNLYSMYFYGEQDTQHNITTGTYTKLINLGTNSISIGDASVAEFNESSGKLTVGANGAGYYYLEMFAGIDDVQANDYVQTVISKNGDSTNIGTRISTYGRGWNSGAANQVVTTHTSCIAYLDVGDTVRFYVYHNEGSTEPTEPNRCSVLGYKI